MRGLAGGKGEGRKKGEKRGGGGRKKGKRGGGKKRGETNIFEQGDFRREAGEFGFVLVFEFGEDGVAVLASVFWGGGAPGEVRKKDRLKSGGW